MLQTFRSLDTGRRFTISEVGYEFWDATVEKCIIPIIEEQIAPHTIRGLMYLLDAKNVLIKKDYNGLIRALTRARINRKIAWDAISDGSGRGVLNDFEDYQSPEEFVNDYVNYLKNGGQHYRSRIPKWYGQKHYFEIWVEKHSLAGTILGYVGDRQVRVVYNRGTPGWRLAYDNSERLKIELSRHEDIFHSCKRLSEELDKEDNDGGYAFLKGQKLKGKQVHILYFGDWDKKGREMDRLLRKQLIHFELLHRVDFRRLALTEEQIKKYSLPRNNIETGEGYQVDALEVFVPNEFKRIVQQPIDKLYDKSVRQLVLAAHTAKNIDSLIREKVRFLEDVHKEEWSR